MYMWRKLDKVKNMRINEIGTGQGKQNVKGRRLSTNGRGLRIGIAVAEFNADITEKLLAGALTELRASGVSPRNTTVVHVPGSFELPLACQKFAETGKYDALIALGCVIKGETDHYYYVAGEAARGIMDVMLKYTIPIGFGIITSNNLKQAQERSGKTNIGTHAARAVLKMSSV